MYFDTTPAVVIRPIELLPSLVNHKAPSAPTAMPSGVDIEELAKLLTTPAFVIRPMVLLPLFVNQRAPSGPLTMPMGELMWALDLYVVIEPAVVMRPMVLVPRSVNHNAPSGPTVISLALSSSNKFPEPSE